jgi:hypothetical protein
MATQPYVLPDLRKLSPAQRKTEMKKYQASLSKDFSHQNTKADVAARKSVFNDRIAIRRGLIDIGGLNGDRQVDELAQLLRAKWNSFGHEASDEEALNRLATDPAVFAETVGDYRAKFPRNFVDVASADRMPESKRFQAKVQIINRQPRGR